MDQVPCWNFRTICGGVEPSRNRVVKPACQAPEVGGIEFLQSIPGLLKILKILARSTHLVQNFSARWWDGGGGVWLSYFPPL
jgi:hypothetical protein